MLTAPPEASKARGSTLASRSLLAWTVLVGLATAVLIAPSTAPAAQSSSQQACVQALNKSLAKVVQAQGKVAFRCAKLASRGKLSGTIDECIAADAGGRLARHLAKTHQNAASRCRPEEPPAFGASDASTVNAAGTAAALEILHSVFGTDLDAGVLRASLEPSGARCQGAVVKTLGRCQRAKLDAFNACKKAGLNDGTIGDRIALQGCLDDDPTGLVAKTCHPVTGKLALRDVRGKCAGTGIDLSTAFPGCATDSPGTLAACLRRKVDCHTCQALSAADRLSQDCDLADDQLANGSCASCVMESPVTRPRVLVVGLDGASWRVLLPLIDAGYLPTIGSLVQAGARADLDCVPAHPGFSCFCPPVWVTIATGTPFAEHGILKLTDPSTDRQTPAIWSVLAARGGTSTLVAYRNTWPSEPDAEFVITEPGVEYAALQRYSSWPVETPHPGRDDTATHTQPNDLFGTLGLLPYAGPQPSAFSAMARDRVSMEALTRLQTDPALGVSTLTVLLLHSPDKSEHLSWQTIQPVPGGPIDESALLAQAAAWTGPIFGPPLQWGNPASQFLEADAWLGTHLAAVPYDYVVFVSDHGMARNSDPLGAPGHHSPTEPEAHVGMFSITGPGIEPGTVLPRATVLDVAPTLAYILRLPVAQNLTGTPLTDGFTADHLSTHCLERVPSW